MWMRLAAATLAVLLGAWMAFDGTRALTVGDYVTPATGPHAGQLGPWSRVLGAVGIPARSTGAKAMHVVCGAVLLAAAAALLLGCPWGWKLVIVAAAVSVWYAPFGTVIGAAITAMAIVSLRKASAS